MFKVIYNDTENEFDTLDSAMEHAKRIGKFVTIACDGFEIVGVFGVDSIQNGKCPNGIIYDWNKSNRIGRSKKSKIQDEQEQDY